MSCDFFFFQEVGRRGKEIITAMQQSCELCEGFKTAKSDRVKQIFEIRKQTKSTCITKGLKARCLIHYFKYFPVCPRQYDRF